MTNEEAWRNAAMRLGEELSSVGPNGYYFMTATQWLDWAMEQQPRGKNSLPQPEQCQCQECKVVLHASDCAVHSEPAYPKGECNCGAQPEQEPDYYGLTTDHLWMSITKDHYNRLKPKFRMACYTTPPRRKPLTEGEIMEIARTSCIGISPHEDTLRFVKAIEAAHGIKGSA